MTDRYAPLREALAASTPGEWAFNGYSRIDAVELLQADEDWPLDQMESKPGRVNPDYYHKVMAEVAFIPAEYGDTATGRHAKDAWFIEQAHALVGPLLAENARLVELLESIRAYWRPSAHGYFERTALAEIDSILNPKAKEAGE